MLHAGSKRTEISKQGKVIRMTIHRVEQRLMASEFLRDRLRSGRPWIIRQLRSHLKGIRKRPISENEKIVTEEENFNI